MTDTNCQPSDTYDYYSQSLANYSAIDQSSGFYDYGTFVQPSFSQVCTSNNNSRLH